MKRLSTTMILTFLFSSALALAQDTPPAPTTTPDVAASSHDMKLEGKQDDTSEMKATKQSGEEMKAPASSESTHKKKKKRKRGKKHHEETHSSSVPVETPPATTASDTK